jgi:hypothetical protein
MAEVEERDAEQDLAGVSEEDKGEAGDILDEVIIQGLDDEGIEDKAEDKTPEGDAKATEKKQAAAPVDDPIKVELDSLKRKVSDLNKALHEERKSKKEAAKADAEAPPLTKAELQKLWKEYQDDPDTLFQISTYIAEQAAKGASKEAIDKSRISENKKETDAFLQKNYPDLYKEGSEMRVIVDNTKKEMGFDDHPYGDFVGTAVQLLLNAPTVMKNIYDKGRSDALSGKAEKTRKEIVKESGLTPKGKGKGAEISSLTDAQKDVASRLGLTGSKLKTFEKIISKNAKSISVEG